MRFKKNFKITQFPLTPPSPQQGEGQGEGKKGQASLEYFILFALVAVLCILSLGRFDNEMRSGLQVFFQKAAGRIKG